MSGLEQLQIDCALIHLQTARILLSNSTDPVLNVAARQVNIAIDRLEDRWDT